MNAQTLYKYCDLTEAQYAALMQAEREYPAAIRMNGAMRAAMDGLIGKDYRITQNGRELLLRAEEVIKSGGFFVGMVYILPDVHPAVVSRWLRKNVAGKIWTSAHAKALFYAPAGYKALCSMFGYQVVNDLLDLDMLLGERRTGALLKVSSLGFAKVSTAAEEYRGKHG